MKLNQLFENMDATKIQTFFLTLPDLHEGTDLTFETKGRDSLVKLNKLFKAGQAAKISKDQAEAELNKMAQIANKRKGSIQSNNDKVVTQWHNTLPKNEIFVIVQYSKNKTMLANVTGIDDRYFDFI